MTELRPVDLHVHSTFSDGTLTPQQLVSYAIKKGLSAFALTDHDTFDGYPSAKEAAEGTDLEVIPGIEFSTTYLGSDVHIVGLDINPDHPLLVSHMENYRRSRDERNEKMVKLLAQNGFDISIEQIRALYGDHILTRAHISRYLYDKGYVSSIRAAFDLYIGENKPYYVAREKITPHEVVRLITEAGGIPVLAHPMLITQPREVLNQLIQELLECGLIGIEAIYSTYTEEEEAYVRSLADTYHLTISGGSDFHGSNKPGLDLATGYDNKLFIPRMILDHLREARRHEMNNKKILFTDLDGTLLNDAKEITPENHACIQDWVNAGNAAVICTGRSISSAIRQAKKLNLTMKGCYIIAFNGAMIYDTYEEKVLYRAQLPKDAVKELFSFAGERNIHIQAYDDTYFFCREDDEAAKRYGRSTNMEYKVDPALPDSLTVSPCKLLLIDYENKQPLTEFERDYSEWAAGKIDMFFSCDQYLELVPVGVNKGTAVKRLCEYLEIPLEQSISAGDAQNDIAMLKVTAKSIVMKNADPSMYQYATHITEEDNNHSGIANTLRKLF